MRILQWKQEILEERQPVIPPDSPKFPEISCGSLQRLLKEWKYMEIGKSRKLKEIYGNIMLLPTISISCFS
jgi:hypothetical protein